MNEGERIAKQEDLVFSSASSSLKVVGGTENPHTHFFSGHALWWDIVDLLKFNMLMYICKEHPCRYK